LIKNKSRETGKAYLDKVEQVARRAKVEGLQEHQ
jgi:hypothetical protein